MQKNTFKYRSMKFVLLWMLIIGVPFIWFITDFLEVLGDPYYLIANVVIMIAFVFVLWSVVDKLPGVNKKGTYYKENGVTVIEYGNNKDYLINVTEIFLSDKHLTSQGINLSIKFDGKEIEFLSEKLSKSTEISDTDFYGVFVQVLAENPFLVQEKDIHGEPIEYWYKLEKN